MIFASFSGQLAESYSNRASSFSVKEQTAAKVGDKLQATLLHAKLLRMPSARHSALAAWTNSSSIKKGELGMKFD